MLVVCVGLAAASGEPALAAELGSIADRVAAANVDDAPDSWRLGAPAGQHLGHASGIDARFGAAPVRNPARDDVAAVSGHQAEIFDAGEDELLQPIGLWPASAGSGFGGSVGSGLRRFGSNAMQPTDVTMQIKPDSASKLNIRLYASGGSARSELVFDQPNSAEPSVRRSGVDASTAWWAVQTRLTNERIQGHRLLFGSDLQVAPAGSGGTSSGSTVAADQRHTLFVEDRSTPFPEVSMSAGVRQDWTNAVTGDPRSWVLLETKAQDDLAVRYAHGDRYRPTGVLTVSGDSAATAAAAAVAAGGARAEGNSISIEHRPAPGRRWTVAAFDNPARTPGIEGPTAADRLLMQGAATVPHNRGVRLAAAESLPDGTSLSVDYLTQTTSTTAAAIGNAPAPASVDMAARYGRVAAALPLDGRWKIGTETVMVGRYGSAAGYSMTHLVLVGSAPSDGSTLALRVYDVLDRHPSDTTAGSALQPGGTAGGLPQPDGRGVRLDVGIPF